MKTMKVRFIKSFDCVKEGDIKEFHNGTGREIINAGLAVEYIEEPKKQAKAERQTKELKTARKTK